MSLIYANRVHEAASGSGSQNLTLLGALSGKATFTSKIQTGTLVPYVLLDGNGVDWEVGFGTLASATELQRTTVVDSSASSGRINSEEEGTPVKISLSTNQHEVFIAPNALNIFAKDEDGEIADPSAVRAALFVDTIAAMTALTGLIDGETVFVKGDAALGDALGACYRWDAADAGSETTPESYEHDSVATGLFKKVRYDIQGLVRSGTFEVDARAADTADTGGAELKLFFRKKATAATAWARVVADYVSSTVGRVRLGIRYAQASAEKFFIDAFSTGDNFDRVELLEPVVLPSRTNANGLKNRALAWLSGVSRLALARADAAATGSAADYFDIPLTKGGYLVGVYETITALKAIDAAAAFIDGDKALLLGSAAAGDVRAFYVKWSASSSASADDVSVFRPSTGAAASGNGRWLKVTGSNIFGGGEHIILAGVGASGSQGVVWYDNAGVQRVIALRDNSTGAWQINRYTNAGSYVDTPFKIPVDGTGKCLIVSGAGPNSGSAAGPFYFNNFNIQIRSALTGTGDPGGASSATWAGMQVSVNAGGDDFDGVAVMGGSFGVVQTLADTSEADKNGLSSGVAISASTAGKIYGGSAAATVASGGVTPQAIGHEVDCFITGTGDADFMLGYNAWSGLEVDANEFSAAYAISRSGAGGVLAWDKGFVLYTKGGTLGQGIKTTGDLFYSESAATLANIFAFSNVTVTGNILDFSHVTLTGDGRLDLKGTSTSAARFRLYEDTDNGSNYVEVIAPAAITANRVLTLPDATDTLVGLATAGILSNKRMSDVQIVGTTALKFERFSDNAYSAGSAGGRINLGTDGVMYHDNYEGAGHKFRSTSFAEVAYIDDGGSTFGAPTGGQKGAGTINAVGVYDDNTLLTDLVLDLAATGGFDAVAYADHPIASEVEAWWFDPEAYASYWKRERHLPGMKHFTPETKPSTGESITRLTAVVEAQAVLIDRLHERLKAAGL